MSVFQSLVSRLRRGLHRTRQALMGGLRALLTGRRLDESLIAELRTALLRADVGPETTERLIEHVRQAWREGRLAQGEEVVEFLKRDLAAMWPAEDRTLRMAPPGTPTVILVAGVNGSGKTTSIAKLAHLFRQQGRSVLVGACDTYRAGAVRQLEIWAERVGVQIVRGQEGGDPAAVAFDALTAAQSRGVEVVILDTAGRLQTQDPLMRQLAKIRGVAARRIAGAPHESLLVVDATAGQNALRQAEEFDRALAPAPGAHGLTGIILAKLDGTARGGIVVAIRQRLGIPVKFVGTGERPEDLEPFDPAAFAEALFGEGDASGY